MANRQKAEERAARAKAALEAQRAKERRRNLLRGGIAVLVLVVLVGVFVYIGNRHGDKVDAAVASGSSDYGVVMGPDTAKNKVVIYEDFLCPFCGMLESGTRTQLAQMAEAGTVQVDYRPFDLLGGGKDDSYSVRSAGAFSVVLANSSAAVAKQFHDLLYENQPEETASTFPSNQDLLNLAVQAGADSSKVSDAILNNDGVDWVTAATKKAEEAKVQGTPTVLINGTLLNNADAQSLLAALAK